MQQLRKAFFGIHPEILLAVLFLPYLTIAQPGIEVGTTVEFGGTIVLLNERGRQRLQQEVNGLYANRQRLNRQLEQLRLLDPLILTAMKKVALPVDFRFLALPLDSANRYWNSAATMPEQFGIRKTAVVNEAHHPLLVTEAMVVYLARLQSRTNNSLRTVVEYIQAGNALQIERLTGVGEYATLDSNSPAVIWKLLARRLVFNREEPIFRPNRTFVLWTHEQSNGQTLTDIAFQYNLPTDRLQPFHSWLNGPAIPAEGSYPVLIRMLPEEYAAATGRLENAKQNPPGPDLGFPVLRRMAPVNSVLNTPVTLYEINGLPGIQAQPGDNVITLAFYGKISVRQFLDYNDMTDRDVARPGEIYYLAPKARRAKVPFHISGRGQTTREVATIYGIRLKHLLRYNQLTLSQPITEGQVLWLQGTRPRNQPIEYRQVPARLQKALPGLEPDSTGTEPVIRPDSTQFLTQNPDLTDSSSIDTTDTEPVATTVGSETKELTTTNPSTPKIKRHTVRSGQTYYAITQLYKLSLSQLYDWNNLSERIPLRVGQQLIVGITAENVRAASQPAVQAKAASPPILKPEQNLKTILNIERTPIEPSVPKLVPARYHIVKTGQTVYRVALINNVTVEQVMRLNNLRNYTIEVGQRLRVK